MFDFPLIFQFFAFEILFYSQFFTFKFIFTLCLLKFLSTQYPESLLNIRFTALPVILLMMFNVSFSGFQISVIFLNFRLKGIFFENCIFRFFQLKFSFFELVLLFLLEMIPCTFNRISTDAKCFKRTSVIIVNSFTGIFLSEIIYNFTPCRICRFQADCFTYKSYINGSLCNIMNCKIYRLLP